MALIEPWPSGHGPSALVPESGPDPEGPGSRRMTRRSQHCKRSISSRPAQILNAEACDPLFLPCLSLTGWWKRLHSCAGRPEGAQGCSHGCRGPACRDAEPVEAVAFIYRPPRRGGGRTVGTAVPSPRRGEGGDGTRLPRVARSPRASLHPWLQPCAPSGRSPVLRGDRLSSAGCSLRVTRYWLLWLRPKAALSALR